MIDLPSPAIIGVVHLKALPGAASHMLPFDEIVTRAVADAKALESAGFDAAVIENFGDAPFVRGRVSPATLAGVAVVADRVRQACRLRLGINLLRNDAVGGLGVAACVGAAFIRVNVLTGVAATDQGIIEGRADRVQRYRKLLGKRVAILADVNVKHAVSLSDPDIARAAKTVAYRGLADGLVVTGRATGEAVDMDDLHRVRAAVKDRRLFVGSGATADTVRELLRHCDGVIVGSSLKDGGDPANAIDMDRARAFVAAAGRG